MPTRDPKNPKPRRKAAGNLPAVREAQATLLPHPPARNTVQSTHVQDRLPSGAGYDVQVTGPTLPQLLERAAGCDDQGYYKLCPGNGGKSWYLTYRWKWGKHAGHYVMAVVERGDLHYGLVLLAEKVHLVQAGTLRPTLDRYGD